MAVRCAIGGGMDDVTLVAARQPRKKNRHRRGKPRPGAQQGRLRRNVGIVVMNAEGKVLAGLRSHANGDKA
ncbi:MAG: hypothetical protein EBQ80_03105, partial [Proteobacteria bacterium]|nr:hypothetical protein [Pseudomonadota bacterium]